MEILEYQARAILAITMPWLLGYNIVSALTDKKTVSYTFISIGYGYFVGWGLVCVLLKLLNNIVNLTSVVWVCLLIVLLLNLTIIIWRKKYNAIQIGGSVVGAAKLIRLTSTQKIIISLAILWAVIRLSSLTFELIVRPMYPWDAYTSWLAKANLWYSKNELTPVISYWNWRDVLNLPKDIYVHNSADERDFIPLIVFWMSAISGGWDEGINFLPWVLVFIAYCFGFSGQARLAGFNDNAIILGLLIFTASPIVNAHIALPGYADLWLGCLYGLAVAALYNWGKDRNRYQLILLLCMSIGCFFVKSQSGPVWTIILLISFVLALVNVSHRQLVVVFFAALSVFVFLVFLGVDFKIGVYEFILDQDEISIPGIFSSVIPDNVLYKLTIVVRDLFAYQSWIFLWFWLAFIAACIYFKQAIIISSYMSFIVLSGLLVIFAYMTLENFYAIELSTVLNRAFLHIFPALIFIFLSQFSIVNEDKHYG